ncbi:MAG: aminomethyl-transferring glycine dehydrogenase subunit GcvPB [Deferribacterota bacterium]|nr:aminomethyl-transferring glycine dehydrogenase subunit GcvPB [Deferribacterota bacterium]
MDSNNTSKEQGVAEEFVWEKSVKDRSRLSIFDNDKIKDYEIDKNLIREDLDLPELSELDIVRHFTRLSQLNYSIDTNFYPLGSCTMKYNPKINEKIANFDGFNLIHPLTDEKYIQGALELIYNLESLLKKLTGMDDITSQPAAGAHGELLGMLLIYAYNKTNDNKKNKILLPDSAHGTNPASASLCGFKPIQLKSNSNGIIDAKSVKDAMDSETAGILITNPNTLGFFEENILEISDIVHKKDGLVYCDGANLNALLGVVNFKKLGVDILHLNLHKTFSTPHGGGGPGSGPLCVCDTLKPFLPVPFVKKRKDRFTLSYDRVNSVGKIHSFYGNFNIMVRAYAYILSLGMENIRKIAEMSVLNANYLKENLKKYYNLPYDRQCMHECIFNDEKQSKYNIKTIDIAKRLIDYGIHPPTIYFPLIVKNALMIEPTETESKQTIDNFVNAMREIAKEAEENPELVREAPHTTTIKRVDEVKAARKPVLRG